MNAGAPSTPGAGPWLRLAAYVVDNCIFLATLGIGWLVWAAAIAGDGQTPAKRLLGLRVVDARTRQTAGLGRMFWARGIFAIPVAALLIVISFGSVLLMPLLDGRNRSIRDRLSATLVLDERPTT